MLPHRRRHRQIGAVATTRLAARRDGGSNAGQRAHPRRDDGDGGRLSRRARVGDLHRLSYRARRHCGDCGRDRRSSRLSSPASQTDIKRVLAYSTMSQLAYMFMGEAVGGYSSGIFHLTTHAYFKALLFMCAGAVIHALGGEQDMRKMGGLRGGCRARSGCSLSARSRWRRSFPSPASGAKTRFWATCCRGDQHRSTRLVCALRRWTRHGGVDRILHLPADLWLVFVERIVAARSRFTARMARRLPKRRRDGDPLAQVHEARASRCLCRWRSSPC